MKTIPFDSRRKNLGHFVAYPKDKSREVLGLEECPTCADTGFVVVQRRPAEKLTIRPGCVPEGDYEVMGPCPFCQAGHRVEFPTPESANDKGGHWGPEGFWRGQETTDLEQMYRASSKPLSIEENRRLWREFVSPKPIGRSMEEAA